MKITDDLALHFPELNKTQLDALEAYIQEVRLESVAWCVSVVDDLHIADGDWKSDSTYKGIKNTLRDRYKEIMGVDPAPSYPIKARLKENI